MNPSSSHDDFDISQHILRYLEEQERLDHPEDPFDRLPREHPSTVLESREILHRILLGVSNRALLIRSYESATRNHHQYPLFDLNRIKRDFKIDDEMFERINFRETLVVSRFDANEPNVPHGVGGLCLNVQKASGFHTCFGNKSQEFVEPKSKFLVHLFSQFQLGTKTAGSRIIAWVDTNLHTLEEKRIEFLEEEMEKSLYVAMQKNCYHVRYKNKSDNTDKVIMYDFDTVQYLICESSSFILMRLLAINRFVGEFQLETLYIDGDICTNYYKSTGPEAGIHNGKKLDTCKIYRKIIEKCGIVHESISVLTLSGQILKQEWRDCDFLLHLNPVADITNQQPLSSEHLLLKETWKDDLELFSKYLDKQTSTSGQMSSYLSDHPEIENLLSDYVQRVLLMKPTNVVDFTIEHFRTDDTDN